MVLPNSDVVRLRSNPGRALKVSRAISTRRHDFDISPGHVHRRSQMRVRR